MDPFLIRRALVALIVAMPALAETVLFKDDFNGKLAEGWTWVREHPGAWRTSEKGLEIRIEPGNMWGPDNDGKNVLVRTLPAAKDGALAIGVDVENVPTEEYEQVDLVWYYDDSHMVKLGLELVHEVLCIVMGREEGDKPDTVAKIPVKEHVQHLRLSARGNTVRGEYRAGSAPWTLAGECSLPVHGDAKASIQCYQGGEGVEHWAKITRFSITVLDK
nr:hypothetical protein [uncultured bacterium]